MEFNESQTKKNLEAAFAGESQAATKYGFYADQAKKDGYVGIQNIFNETKSNEVMHAKIWFKYLHGDKIPDTMTNLKDASAGENYETNEMYPEFAKVAREEGFDEIACRFDVVGQVEAHHEDRYNRIIDRLDKGEIFKRDESTVWKCNVCGHLHVGATPPEICPVCSHPKSHFVINCVQY